jgi:RecJ-like exonuclease
MNESEKECAKCGGKVSGYKCDVCGTEVEQHDEKHSCGGNHCVAKCSSCHQAETKCRCS